MIKTKCYKQAALAVLLTGSLLATSVSAAINWSAMNGPAGGQISSFEFIDNNTIWASSKEGLVYKSTDAGVSWQPVLGLKGSSSINNALQIEIDSSGKYYALIGGSLYSSGDQGANWTHISDDISGIYLDSNDLLYKSDVGLDTSVFQYVVTVSSSSDGGANWAELGELARNVTSAASVITEDAGGNLYAMIYPNGVYRSTDGGANWSEITELSAFPVALDADQAGNLYASTNDGVFVSNDNGASWTEKTDVTTSVDHFSIGNGSVYAANWNKSTYWRSDDQGASWQSVLLSQSDTLINRLDVSPTGDLYINAYPRYDRLVFDMPNPQAGRILKIPAGGSESYLGANSGLGHAGLNRLLQSGSNLVAMAEYGNIWISTDGGNSWSIPASAPAVGVFGLGQHGGTLYAMSSSGIYGSDDDGASWTQLSAESGHYSEFASDGNGRLYIYGEYDLKVSDDNGVNWSVLSFGLTDCHGRSTDDENALAVSSDGVHVFINECYSNDAGANWTKSTFPATSSKVIHSLLLDDSGKLLAGKNIGGIEASVDNGTSYSLSNGGMDSFGQNPGGLSTLFKDNSDTFYALAPYGVGAYLSGVWSSTDGGANWLRDNTGLPALPVHGEFGALAMTQLSDGRLLLSTAGSGLYVSGSGSSGGSGGGSTADTTAPVISVPANITVAAESADGTAATQTDIAAFLSAASATDDVDGSVSVSNDVPATFAADSTTTVTFTATDAAGNTATATATVTVQAFDSGSSGGTSGGSSGGTTGGTSGGTTGGTSDGSGSAGALGWSGILLMLLMSLVRRRPCSGLRKPD